MAAILNPETSPDRGAYYLGTFETVARRMSLEPIIAEVRSETDLERVIAALGNDHGGLIVIPNLFVYNNRGLIANLAIRSKTPTVLAGPDFAIHGGLIDYGPDFPEMYRRAGSYVDRILRGTQPGDLPIELPTKWHLVINLKTAQSLGLPVSNSLLVSADEVIE